MVVLGFGGRREKSGKMENETVSSGSLLFF